MVGVGLRDDDSASWVLFRELGNVVNGAVDRQLYHLRWVVDSHRILGLYLRTE